MKLYITLPEGETKKRMLPDRLRDRLDSLFETDENTAAEQLTSEQMRNVLKNYDAVLTSWGCAKILGAELKQGKTRFIGHIGGTVHSLVDAEVFETNACVVSANCAFARPIAENVLYGILTGLKRWHESDWAMKKRETLWNEHSFFASSLFSKKVGLIGYGQIARELIIMLRPFQVQILVSDDYVKQAEADRMGFVITDTQTVCSQCDIISLHHTLTKNTYHIIGREQLDKMKNGAVLVNMARGALVDQSALEEELKRERIYAVLDVYESEPLPYESKLRDRKNVFLTPHLGAYSDACYNALAEFVVEQLICFKMGKPLDGMITKERYEQMSNEGPVK